MEMAFGQLNERFEILRYGFWVSWRISIQTARTNLIAMPFLGAFDQSSLSYAV